MSDSRLKTLSRIEKLVNEGKINEVLHEVDLLEKEAQTFREQGNSDELADSLKIIGRIYSSIGKFKHALNSYHQSLTIFEELGNKREIIVLYNNIGLTYEEIRELDQALDYYDRDLKLLQQWDNKELDEREYFIAVLSMNIGRVYSFKGDLTKSLSSYQEALALFKKLKRKSEEAICLNNIGTVHKMKGELDRALQIYEKSLVIVTELENNQEHAKILTNIGNIYHMMGELQSALDSYKKSLVLFEKIGISSKYSLPLFNLIEVSALAKLLEQANSYLQELQNLNKQEDNKIISQRCRVAESLVLKTSGLSLKRGEAEKILLEFVKEDVGDHELVVLALLSLCDLLLTDLRAFGDPEVLTYLHPLVNQLEKVNQLHHSYWLLASTYVFKSKLALLELDIRGAQKFLTEARQAAEKYHLQRLVVQITAEQELFREQKDNWNYLAKRNASMVERLDLAMIEGLATRMSEGRLPVTSFPVPAYKGSEPYVFVSYSHKNKIIVYSEIKWLYEEGYRIWYDEGIPPTAEYPIVITEAIDKCSFFLVFVSPHINESEYIRKEIQMAKDKKKTVLPIYIEDTILVPELSELIGETQAIRKWNVQYYQDLIKILPSSLK
ncbi:MAG: tetratricopeptide repeat protein [Promethearchaeota archaeon]